MQLEFRIEDVHAKLARAHQNLSQDVREGDSLLHQDALTIADVRARWKQHQRDLHKLSGELVMEEAELEPLHHQLTQAQWDVKCAEDDLYASVTGGIRPADSDTSLEDRLLERAAGSAVPPLRHRSHLSDQIFGMPNEHLTLGNKSIEHSVSTPAQALGAERRNLPRVSSQGPSPSDQYPQVQRSGSSEAKKVLTHERQVDQEIMYCGFGFPQEDLYRYHGEGSRNHLLLAVKELAEIRRTYFRTSLGFDLSKINASMQLTGRLQKDVIAGVAQKLTNIRMPTIHTRQFISLWGRGMSQNSALESSRTLRYGGHEFEQLVKQGKIGPIVKIIQDVRNLEVPLSQTGAINQPDIAVGATKDVTASSSIAVQPSGE